jgi:hypothetical protein
MSPQKNKLNTVFLSLLIGGSIFAHGIFDSLPAVEAGAGMLVFNGNVGKGNTESPFGSVRAGYSVSLEDGIGKLLSLNLTGLFGELSKIETSQTNGLNFETKIAQADLSVIFHTEKLFPRSVVTPYLGAGIGFLSFNPYGDLYANNGEKYYYWSDGSIRNEAQTIQNMYTAHLLVLNYKFNTPLDPTNSYSHHTCVIPLTFGFNFNILDNLNAKLGSTYFYSFSGHLDNAKVDVSSESYLYTYVAFNYKFNINKKPNSKPDDKRYQKVDFSQFDADFLTPTPADPKKK